MEVHHHSHPSTSSGTRKKWTHYFWEFLMLFLAVFCGFLAEYQLEHKIERDRAKELAVSFYNELKADSAAIKEVMNRRARKDKAFSYMRNYFRDSSIMDCSKTFALNFTYAYVMFSPSIFEPRDAILEQLKSSGSLRYFKNKDLQSLTGNLSVAIANLRKRNEYEWTFYHENIHAFLNRHNDMEFHDRLSMDSKKFYIELLDSYENSAEVFPFQLAKADSFDRSFVINMTGTYQLILRGSSSNQYREYITLSQSLMDKLRSVYHLK
ncbi:MAG TPA: hypothetical protein VF144_10845 [Chitinophagaceae bacterium]